MRLPGVGLAKHFEIAIGEDALTFKVKEARLDGLYVLRTSVAATAMSDAEP